MGRRLRRELSNIRIRIRIRIREGTWQSLHVHFSEVCVQAYEAHAVACQGVTSHQDPGPVCLPP